MATKKKTETQAPAPQAVTEQVQDTEMKGGVHAAAVTEQEDEGRTQDAEQTAAAVTEQEDEGRTQDAEQTAAAVQSPEAPADPQADVAREETGPVLESLSVLADRHRVSSWQQAALLRFMDWTDDKLVSDAEYRAALENLKRRRIGGGRR